MHCTKGTVSFCWPKAFPFHPQIKCISSALTNHFPPRGVISNLWPLLLTIIGALTVVNSASHALTPWLEALCKHCQSLANTCFFQARR